MTVNSMLSVCVHSSYFCKEMIVMRKTTHRSHRILSAVLSIVCSAALLVPSAAIPGAALTGEPSGAASFAQNKSGAPDIAEVSTEAELYSMLTSSGDVNIKLTANISASFTDDRMIRYPVGTGRKVLDLNGYSINIDAQYYYTANGYVGGEIQNLFGLPAGSELVVNDSSVRLTAGSPNIQSGGIYFTNSEVYASDCFSQRNLFFLMGGTLTINSGNFTAGNVKTVGKGDYHLMANGSVVQMSGGSFTLNGGTLTGYGINGTDFDDSWKTGVVQWTRNAVVAIGSGCLDNCTVNINDGVINALGCSDAFCLDTASDTTIQSEDDLVSTERISVRACTINLDHYDDVVIELGAYTPLIGATKDRYWVLHPGNGRVGLNVKFDENTECYIGTDNVTVQPTPFYAASSMVIKPKDEIGQASVLNLDSYIWDVLSPCRFEVSLPDDYFPKLTDDDIIRSNDNFIEYELVDESNNTVARFTEKLKEGETAVIFDLSEKLNDSQKDSLIQGDFYYLKVSKIETRESASTLYKITSPDRNNEKGTVILISEPAKIENVNAVINTPKAGQIIGTDIKQEGSEAICAAEFDGWYVDNARVPEGSKFEYDKAYEARVKFIPKDGHRFSDTAKLTVNGREAATIEKSADGSVLVGAVYTLSRDVISYVNCTVTAPAAGKNPPTTAVPEDEEYTVESVEVYESTPPYKVLSSSDTYEAATKYMVRIRVKAKDGMRFSDGTAFCVNHYNADSVTIAGDSVSAVIDKEFTTGSRHLDTASVTTERSVIKEGDKAYTPEFVSDEPSDYEVTFRSWLDYTQVEESGNIHYLNEGDSFITGRMYNLNVTLKPKSDKYVTDTHTVLTINGVEAKFSYYDSSKQEYYYSLPMVCKKVIMNAYCTVTEPKAGESPVFTAESADPTMYSVGYVDYTRVRNGSETHLGSDYVFAEGYEYRVYVEFEPTEEYTFGDDAKFFINGVLAKKYYSKSFRIFYVGDHEHKLTHYDAVEPTCSWEGVVEHYECSVCMKNYEDEACTKEITGSVYIPKTAHTPAEPVKENETPFTYDSVIYCTVCGEEISREWIATSGPSHTHTPGEEHKENEIAATCAKEGEYDLIIRCKECDDIMAITHIETDKLPHTPGEVKKENDTGDEWDEVMYCTECGEELSRTHVKDGTPVVTGIYGDVDCDGTITANDALMILRQSVGMEHFDSELIFISDVDGDGEVTANDALAVLRNSVGMNDDNLVGKPVN